MATSPLVRDESTIAGALEAAGGEPLARFRPPSRSFSPLDRLRAQEKVAGALHDFLRRSGSVEAPEGEFARIEIPPQGMSPDALCDFQETLLKALAWSLTADEIGGMNVTRLDRLCRRAHPRMPYGDAIALLQARAWPGALGDDLDRRAQAALVTGCGELPVQLTRIPALPRVFDGHPFSESAQRVECVDYLLPFSGWSCRGHIAYGADGSVAHAGCAVDMGRMMQCFLGLDAPESAWFLEE